ncbi:hypothetical protein [Caenimonas soli]|uniref:hypothetical protein n=1 Tax=Caenimonas soli TaxID=2735555 RepID=UPI001552F741|nr:hypothetical protein [Caenimonas soli]NPC54888.1 hypothetical protein [Caenimonas soli]
MSFEANGDRATFQLRFRSLVGEANEVTCPCDAAGHVVMDEMSERARSSYLFARAMVGRFYAPPEITPEVHRELAFA